jgi:hypothetical protein
MTGVSPNWTQTSNTRGRGEIIRCYLINGASADKTVFGTEQKNWRFPPFEYIKEFIEEHRLCILFTEAHPLRPKVLETAS